MARAQRQSLPDYFFHVPQCSPKHLKALLLSGRLLYEQTGMAELPNQPPQPFGRVRLTQVVESWAAEHPLNPRLLASELADVLRTIGPSTQVLDHTAASVTLYDPTTGAGGITIEALADYFDRYSVGAPADTIETTNGAAQAGAVLLSKQWIGRVESEAEARATIAAGLQQVAPAPAPNGGALPTEQHQSPLSGSTPECLALRQAQQRQEGEQSASERLEAAEQQAATLRKEIERRNAREQTLEQALQQAREEAERYRRAAAEDCRKLTLAEDQLREHAGIIEFMNPNNHLSPVEGRRSVMVWCEMTENGQTDPTTAGIGVGPLAGRLWQQHFGKPKEIVVKRLQWFLTWPARKLGGAVAKKAPKKG
ncbi:MULTISPECIES: hypothetical protein [unclassified Pseudomonas]|uniref:hypothetical protein n=1 Tax=unclassified Pseudomonas TaxID=196821 RepID=UPI0012678ACA|nr:MULTISPECIES: hypothetical protein [unclassified Pseudomonas]